MGCGKTNQRHGFGLDEAQHENHCEKFVSHQRSHEASRYIIKRVQKKGSKETTPNMSQYTVIEAGIRTATIHLRNGVSARNFHSDIPREILLAEVSKEVLFDYLLALDDHWVQKYENVGCDFIINNDSGTITEPFRRSLQPSARRMLPNKRSSRSS